MEVPGIIAVNPEGGKVARVNAVSAFIEAGNVYLPRNAEWVHDFVEECASFPNGTHDDQVDGMSQALHRYYYLSGTIAKAEEAYPSQREALAARHLARHEKPKRKGVSYVG
jgi:phage terminase large subunit-like protein